VHSKMKNIEAFYGCALIHSYKREREIQCTGLFIENDLVPYIEMFQSDKYDEHSHYIHLMDRLREISFHDDAYPLNKDLIFPDGLEVLSYDITYLKNIYGHMNNMDLAPRVRVKYLSAWQMIQKQHRALLDVLERSKFDPRAVCDMDWSPLFSKIGSANGIFQ
jgi:hypothetical protein